MAEQKKTVEATVRNIRRATRKKYTAEEKDRIFLEGLRGESTIAELCRKEGIHPNLYYKWSKEFLEAGKQRLVGDTQRQTDSQEVVEMRSEIEQYLSQGSDECYCLLTCPPKPGPKNKLGKGQKKTYTQEKADHMELLEEWLISLQP
jgi:transposase